MQVSSPSEPEEGSHIRSGMVAQIPQRLDGVSLLATTGEQEPTVTLTSDASGKMGLWGLSEFMLVPAGLE